MPFHRPAAARVAEIARMRLLTPISPDHPGAGELPRAPWLEITRAQVALASAGLLRQHVC